MGIILSTEDEPDELEWGDLHRRQTFGLIPEDVVTSGRIAEIRRRNTLCLPHLKSTYPTERLSNPVLEEDLKKPLAGPSTPIHNRGKRRNTEAELHASHVESNIGGKRKVFILLSHHFLNWSCDDSTSVIRTY